MKSNLELTDFEKKRLCEFKDGERVCGVCGKKWIDVTDRNDWEEVKLFMRNRTHLRGEHIPYNNNSNVYFPSCRCEEKQEILKEEHESEKQDKIDREKLRIEHWEKCNLPPELIANKVITNRLVNAFGKEVGTIHLDRLENMIKRKIDIFLHGEFGRGKSNYAGLIIEKAINEIGMSAYYVEAVELDKLEYSKLKEEKDRLSYIKDCDFLVVDEVAANPHEGKTRAFKRVLDYRHGWNKRTICITNMGLDIVRNTYEWVKSNDDKEGAMESRMNRFDFIEVIGKDFRSK